MDLTPARPADGGGAPETGPIRVESWTRRGQPKTREAFFRFFLKFDDHPAGLACQLQAEKDARMRITLTRMHRKP